MPNFEEPRTDPGAPPRVACRRRRVLGVDLWVEPPGEEAQAIADVGSAARATHLRLVGALEGELHEGPLRGDERATLRLRFLARRDDVHVTDEAICELLACLPARLRWTLLAKLDELDGIPDFTPLPAP